MKTHLLQSPTTDHHDSICLGFFQQDDLEQKLGYFRMSASCNFYLTVQDVFNAHYVDKTKLLLALTVTEKVDYKSPSTPVSTAKWSQLPQSYNLLMI
ncbi:hypothetical protein PoB_004477400 [Plakobranchus ocellatus]|uniref:Uncharacterized protein n=1 Tax=Plakobranchus ocellatus TaxID=259542 RepID=A0AAV4BIZ0_9GAST|nr:hypothetical protein PoB_004477400 [Plakobranchus ocellatus]